MATTKTRAFSRVTARCAAAAVCAALVFGGAGVSSAGARPAARPTVVTAKVKIQGYLFRPTTLTVAQYTKVTWTNYDSTGHNVTFKNFGSPILGLGKTWSHTFKRVGTFKYRCTLHPEMTAKVVVTG
jgi:plastocyanin